MKIREILNLGKESQRKLFFWLISEFFPKNPQNAPFRLKYWNIKIYVYVLEIKYLYIYDSFTHY